MRAQRDRLADGRWHFWHGPIDLVVSLDGPGPLAAVALEAGWQRFGTVLSELSAELALLRTDGTPPAQLRSPIAQRMAQACLPFHRDFGLFVTPMAAVAGSVAQEVLGCIVRAGITRACVNNGGDIALHLDPGQAYRVGIVADLVRAGVDGSFRIDADSGVRGIATSGWRGRSLSLGIADAVTVLAVDAAAADAAATMIANHVNLESDAIVRRAARDLRDDSDLGALPVTVAVGDLQADEIDTALDRGQAFAQRLLQAGLIRAAVLMLAGRARVAAMPSLARRLLLQSSASSNATDDTDAPHVDKERQTWPLTSASCK